MKIEDDRDSCLGRGKLTVRKFRTLFVYSSLVAAVAITGAISIPRATAQPTPRPEFARTFPVPAAAVVTETTLGRRLIAAMGQGLSDSADPACRSARGLTRDAYGSLARTIFVTVADARDAANATGLDAQKADAEYVAVMGPDRLRSLAALSAGTDAASTDFRSIWTYKMILDVVGDTAHTLSVGFEAERFPNAGKFSAAFFDGRENFALRIDTDARFERALAALPAQSKSAYLLHRRTSSDAWTKATDMLQANRLSGRDVISLIKDDLARHCITG